jgi:hypothetical protein
MTDEYHSSQMIVSCTMDEYFFWCKNIFFLFENKVLGKQRKQTKNGKGLVFRTTKVILKAISHGFYYNFNW